MTNSPLHKTARMKPRNEWQDFRVICPTHGERNAITFMGLNKLLLECGCVVTGVNDRWKWKKEQ